MVSVVGVFKLGYSGAVVLMPFVYHCTVWTSHQGSFVKQIRLNVYFISKTFSLRNSFVLAYRVDNSLDASLDESLLATVAGAGETLVAATGNPGNVNSSSASVLHSGKSVNLSVDSDVRVVHIRRSRGKVAVLPLVHTNSKNAAATNNDCSVLEAGVRGLSETNSNIQVGTLTVGKSSLLRELHNTRTGLVPGLRRRANLIKHKNFVFFLVERIRTVCSLP